ncbi:hypothetical protein SLEP1_g27826 [Rubroshorea leprosula]|uniref:Uncharacterized protein n=1 Tax=Rubroshorea leprosula TaxID=152421 RepID=A0AAV5JRL9_9ROSI|nr:hypothetical protein SLEP1_g27826 [Rubroshorea leprosula]
MPKIAQNRPNLLNPKSPKIVENHLDFLHPSHAPSSVHPIDCFSSPPFFSICSGFLSSPFSLKPTKSYTQNRPKLPKIAEPKIAQSRQKSSYFFFPQSWNHPNPECVGAIAVNHGIFH